MTTLSGGGRVETPVAFFVFNRPDLTARVFAAIRQARPKRLLVIADGPRRDTERAKTEATRAVIRVDWDCAHETLYSDDNLGCKARVASGIDWVFERCEEAIILEDDCLPSASFFPFCDEMLSRYREDERVMCVGGLNLFTGAPTNDGDYYFARYGATWGWATWRRAWRHFDLDMQSWPAFRRAGRMRDLFATREEQWFWTRLFDEQHAGDTSAWDYQWLYARLVQSGLTVAPWTNLVRNLGFEDGTHFSEMPPIFEPATRSGELTTLRGPAQVVPSRAVDHHYFHRIFNPHGLAGVAAGEARRLVRRVASRLA